MTVDDLYEPLKEHKSNLLGEKVAKVWEDECRKVNLKHSLITKDNKRNYNVKSPTSTKPSLLKVLLRCFGFQLFLYGIFLAILELGFK